MAAKWPTVFNRSGFRLATFSERSPAARASGSNTSLAPAPIFSLTSSQLWPMRVSWPDMVSACLAAAPPANSMASLIVVPNASALNAVSSKVNPSLVRAV